MNRLSVEYDICESPVPRQKVATPRPAAWTAYGFADGSRGLEQDDEIRSVADDDCGEGVPDPSI